MKYSTNGGRTWSNKIIVADFGPTFQNGEINATYNPVNGSIYVYFTSCKALPDGGTLRPE